MNSIAFFDADDSDDSLEGIGQEHKYQDRHSESMEKAHVIPSMKLLQGVGFLQRLNLEPDSLLGLCNEARSYLDDQKTLEPRSRITRLLRDILYCEKHYPPAIPFETIQEAHIDKLLTELMKRENTAKTSSYAVIAHSLERKWSLRFRERYFDIDQLRYEALSRDGMLRNVVFNQQAKCNRRLWQAEKMSALSEAEGNLRFEPGDWWLNMACAKRDGAVGSANEVPTKGCYGVAVLALLHGREQLCTTTGIVQYTRECTISEAPVSLMSQVGSRIRIIRGHLLNSPLAPKAGIRYDGIYTLKQYGHIENPQTRLHRISLTFERALGQRTMQELDKIPRPSEIDIWKLFEKYEGEMVKKWQGLEAFQEWKLVKARERVEKRKWRCATDATKELNIGTQPIEPLQ